MTTVLLPLKLSGWYFEGSYEVSFPCVGFSSDIFLEVWECSPTLWSICPTGCNLVHFCRSFLRLRLTCPLLSNEWILLHVHLLYEDCPFSEADSVVQPCSIHFQMFRTNLLMKTLRSFQIYFDVHFPWLSPHKREISFVFAVLLWKLWHMSARYSVTVQSAYWCALLANKCCMHWLASADF